MDYDLDRLGPTEFEHMIQALAIAELGISVTTFGAGKDAGREATFRGKVVAPRDSNLELWDGYGIVQAKTIRFANDPAKNAEILIASIGAELDKFVPGSDGEPDRAPRPNYYIVATNARLSAGAGGGVDALGMLLTDHHIALSGQAIWHYEQICRLLDVHDGIRRTYAGFLTPGDILSQLNGLLDAGAAKIGAALKSHAASQIAARQDLKLETSVFNGAGKVDLSEVAIDLPASDLSGLDVMVVEHILEAGDNSLRASVRGADAYGFVIVGGPGQGKSTLGQIVCQAYRVALLDEHSMPITPKIDKAISGTRARLKEIGLAEPRNRRWPVFIDLSQLADALAENPAITTVEFVAIQLKNQGSSITAAQVATWLATWPWVLVLDGLDEVPARRSRDAVIQALNDLIVESRLNDWDVLIVCTTRPQGYEGEFSELNPEQMELRDLSPKEGLDYGRQIIQAKFEGDPEKASRVLDRLELASNQTHSARLMRTPLQVTIMEYLLEELAEVPNTRHELFDGFYQAIYSRESSKAGYLGNVLKLYSEQIEWVHEQAALFLQVQSEKSGGSSATIPESEIVGLFVKRLREQQFDEAQIEGLAARMDKATKQRLVLLVPRTKGQITFEVKSLQEYMAARAVASGEAGDVFERLDVLAPSAYWRNTWQLAAGRIYTERPHERDALLERIRRLDTDSKLGRFVGFGARLAIELLEDDFAYAVPAHRKSMLNIAMTQVTRWPGPELKKLATIARGTMNGTDQSARSMVGDALSDAFSSSGRSRVGAIAVLRDWVKDSGASGAFARKLLHEDDSWRPTNDRSVMRAKKSVAAILEAVVSSMDLTGDEAQLWASAKRNLEGVSVPTPVTPAEAVTISRAEIDLSFPEHLIRMLTHSDMQDLLIKISNEAPIESAPAPITVRRILIAAVQSRPVGASPLISHSGSGLF